MTVRVVRNDKAVWHGGRAGSSSPSADRLVAVAGLLALSVCAHAVMMIDGPLASDVSDNSSSEARPPETRAGGATALASREVQVGAYGGVSHTQPSTVAIQNPGKTDLKVRDFSWIGRPFKAPIYYGARVLAWQPVAPFGGMVDFIHAKAIANPDDIATFEGTHNGRAMPGQAKIGDTFRHLEFSHGHNMLTLNGLARLGLFSRIRPYVGAGAGVSLPHTEIAFRREDERTYTYQFAGFVGQALAGIEFKIGRISVFAEYKFTYAPYDVPLSHEPYGWLLVTDLWDQFRDWYSGTVPPGGRLSTTLASHHAVGGVLVRVSR